MVRTLYVTTNPAHASSRRRERLLREAGAELEVLAWPTDKLNPSYAQRLGTMAGLTAKIAAHRGAEVIWPWGLDACFAASAGAALSPATVVWDISDLLGFQLRPKGARPHPLDAAERLLIARADHLILSSEGFYAARYASLFPRARTLLIENLIEPHPTLEAPAPPRAARDPNAPLKVVYAGIFRSERLLDVIADPAVAAAGPVEFHLHGVRSRVVPEGRIEALAGQAGIVAHGRYRDPEDLAGIYQDADAVFGLLDVEADANEAHLLPNRYYHAGYFGLPIVATSGTHLGDVIAREGRGPVIENTPQALAEALRTIRSAGPAPAPDARARARFAFSDEYGRALARIAAEGRRRSGAGAPALQPE